MTFKCDFFFKEKLRLNVIKTCVTNILGLFPLFIWNLFEGLMVLKTVQMKRKVLSGVTVYEVGNRVKT